MPRHSNPGPRETAGPPPFLPPGGGLPEAAPAASAAADGAGLSLGEQEFQPQEIVRDIVESLRPGAEARGLRLIHHSHAGPRLVGHADRLRRILRHLLGNAVAYTAQGRVAVECSRLAREGEAVWLRFVVSDTGCGMSAATLAQLFRRPAAAPSRDSLALCKALAEGMDGRLGVTSVEGRGSTFWLELPFQPAAAPQQEDGAARQARRAAPRPQRDYLLLLVEDNAVNRLLTRRLIEQLGHRVDSVADGAEAVAAAARTRYDLILMDLWMPVLDGPAACRAIRAEEAAAARSATPIVALTASSHARDREHCLAAGMDDVLGKPLRRQELALLLARWLQREGL